MICSVFISFNVIFVIFFTYIKIFKDSSAKYYQNNKKRLQKNACERYQSLFKEEKEKKQQYGREQYKSLSEDEKQKPVEYR